MSATPPQFLEASASSRRNLLVLLLSLGAMGFVLAHFVEPALYLNLRLMPPCERISWLRGVLLAALLFSLLLAILLLAYVRALKRASQFPISDRWLLRRTRISRGRSLTVLQGILGLTAACLLGMSALLLHGLLSPTLLRPPADCTMRAV